MHLSAGDQNAGDCLFAGGLCGDFDVFYTWLCLHSNRNVFICVDRKPDYAAVSTFAVLLILHLWGGLLDFIPSTAISGVIGIIAIITIVALIIYQLTKNWVISAVIEAIGVIACVVTYVVKSSLFENLLVNLLGKLDISGSFSNVYMNKLLDVSDLILCFSLIALFVFLTIQTIQKRRWS